MKTLFGADAAKPGRVRRPRLTPAEKLKARAAYIKRYMREYRSSPEYKEADRRRQRSPEYREAKRRSSQRHGSTTNGRVATMLRKARLRAREKGMAFTIDESDVVIPERCPILGIPLCLELGRGNQPGSPSLDRIDPAQGYVKGNVQVISWRANDLKRNATPEELRMLADNATPALRKKRGRTGT